MRTITATQLARNLREVLDRLAVEGGEIIVERNHRQVARILPGPGCQSALEAMADLYRTLSPEAGAGWERDGRGGPGSRTVGDEFRDPWDS